MMDMDQIGLAGIEPPEVDVDGGRGGGGRRRNRNSVSRGNNLPSNTANRQSSERGGGSMRQSALLQQQGLQSFNDPRQAQQYQHQQTSARRYAEPEVHVQVAPVQGAPVHVPSQIETRPPHAHSHPSFVSDLTSTAGYTLSGAHDRQQQQQSQSRDVRAGDINQLIEQGFSFGLAKALANNTDAFDHRIWVVDNSGSMQIGDGHRIVESVPVGGGNRKVIATPSSRWEEIQDTVIYHCQMAAVLNSPTIFRLLNDPGPAVGKQEFTIAAKDSRQTVDQDIKRAQIIMARTKPDGVTPLTDHIFEMKAQIREMLPRLQRTGQRVAVILATDGLPTDENGYGGDDIKQEFIKALRALEGLPIWLVIRLCTDEEKVTNFYNELDGLLELSLEVLDDFLGEAKEVHKVNPWLNYSLPMHRCRELGYHDRLFDLIDERALTKGELRECCVLLFGVDIDAIPDPVADWKEFVKFIKEQLKKEQAQWNPMKKKLGPWIDVKALNRKYGPGPKCTIM